MSIVLFAAPFTGSMPIHLYLRQQGKDVDVRWQKRGPNRQIAGQSYAQINPKRRVPALIVDDGPVQTEIVSLLFYLGQSDRAHLQWLSFLATELHQGILGPLFDPGSPDATREDVLARLLPPCLSVIEGHLQDRTWMLSDTPGTVDAYLYWASFLLRQAGLDAQAPQLQRMARRYHKLPHVAEVLAEQAAVFDVSLSL